jgi:hypothetical protein
MNVSVPFHRILPLLMLAHCTGCMAPHERLTFPTSPVREDRSSRWYDANGNGVADFALLLNEGGRLHALAYDDNEDGTPDRLYRRDVEPAPNPRPHLIVMLDSIPYQSVEDRFHDGCWPWFDPPVKVIPPFPTMSGLIFTAITHAPPLRGMINRYYNRTQGKTINGIVNRAFGEVNPWHDRLHYRAKYWQNGLSFLKPREWYAAELVRLKRAFDQCPDRVCVVYVASTSGMLSRFGRAGLDESLDGATQLCLQLLYERQGHLDISILADHGHNLVPGKRIDLKQTLRDAGFHPARRLSDPNDVVVENDGMVNYIGLHTANAPGVAAAVVQREEVELAVYLKQDQVIACAANGSASIEHREGRFRYTPIDGDVLNYRQRIEQWRGERKVDADGFIAADDWFAGTVDHQYPDGPQRLWRAFHGAVVNTPDVMLTLRDGWCTGLGFLELFISMQSIHGGLDQINSATFVMTTTGRTHRPLRSDEVLETIEPGILQQLDARAAGIHRN